MRSSDKLPVRVGVGHCSKVDLTIGSTKMSIVGSIVGSAVSSSWKYCLRGYGYSGG